MDLLVALGAPAPRPPVKEREAPDQGSFDGKDRAQDFDRALKSNEPKKEERAEASSATQKQKQVERKAEDDADPLSSAPDQKEAAVLEDAFLLNAEEAAADILVQEAPPEPEATATVESSEFDDIQLVASASLPAPAAAPSEENLIEGKMAADDPAVRLAGAALVQETVPVEMTPTPIEDATPESETPNEGGELVLGKGRQLDMDGLTAEEEQLSPPIAPDKGERRTAENAPLKAPIMNEAPPSLASPVAETPNDESTSGLQIADKAAGREIIDTAKSPSGQTDRPAPPAPAATAASPLPSAPSLPPQTSEALHFTARHQPLNQAAPSSAPAEAAQQVVAAIRSDAGGDGIEVRLDPPELGRVRIHFSIDRADAVLATVTTDRSDTLDLMRRNATDLVRELERAGFSSVELDFSSNEKSAWRQDDGKPNFSFSEADDDTPAQDVTYVYARPRIDGRLDRLV